MKGLFFLGLLGPAVFYAQIQQDSIKESQIEAINFNKRLPVAKEIINVQKDLNQKNLGQDFLDRLIGKARNLRVNRGQLKKIPGILHRHKLRIDNFHRRAHRFDLSIKKVFPVFANGFFQIGLVEKDGRYFVVFP